MFFGECLDVESLKDLGAAAVVDLIEKEDDIAHLEIPITLVFNLVKQFKNDWSARYYRANINCCRDHREGVKKEHEWCDFLKITKTK